MKKSLHSSSQGIPPLTNPGIRSLVTIILLYKHSRKKGLGINNTKSNGRVRDKVDDELPEMRSKFTAEAMKKKRRDGG
jgi:hypothetical protein